MKTLIQFIIIITFFNSLNLNEATGQIVNGEAVYHIESLMDFSPTDTISNDTLRQVFKKMEIDSENSLDILLSLKFNQDHSLFQYAEVGKDIGDLTFNTSLILARNLGNIYTNLQTGEILHHKKFKGEQFIVRSNLKDYRWNLNYDEVKRIGKHQCLKATLVQKVLRDSGEFIERIIEAWYTPEIKISSGPSGYGGLPGLILELKIGNLRKYYLAQVHPKINKNEDFINPDVGKVMKKREYEKMVADYVFEKLRKGREKNKSDKKTNDSGFRLFEKEN